MSEGPSAPQPGGGAFRLLIVEDSVVGAETLTRLVSLSSQVEVVGIAADSAQALKMSRSLKPDVVLLDLHLPDQEGTEIIRPLLERLPHSQVIMMSVEDDPSCRLRALEAGAVDYLVKPFHVQELLASIRRGRDGGALRAG